MSSTRADGKGRRRSPSRLGTSSWCCDECVLCTRIIYDRKFLLDCRSSPLAQTPPSCLPDIPGVTSPPVAPTGSKKAEPEPAVNNHESPPADKGAAYCTLMPRTAAETTTTSVEEEERFVSTHCHLEPAATRSASRDPTAAVPYFSPSTSVAPPGGPRTDKFPQGTALLPVASLFLLILSPQIRC
ncbi:hypothetical protein Z043_123394 [Scleropages formosus]|uniref:Uncharacterized protein n=1 Tax=Scleropages formosus TaxID=113540 RepID=A0A0P7TM35_SCLFO|nr:hypothetical protein Z043_123394 [Scleropages formosus]